MSIEYDKIKENILESIKSDESMGDMGRRWGFGNLMGLWFQTIAELMVEDRSFRDAIDREMILYFERKDKRDLENVDQKQD